MIPKVSIIVPNYNHAQFLGQRFDSIFNQTFQDFEVIILDDCSTDNSREIIEKYRYNPKVSNIIYNSTNSGTSYKQWYKGINYANGELIWIAESDDWCDLRFLEILLPHFEDEEVSIAFADSKFIYNESFIQEVFGNNIYNKLNGLDFLRNEMLAKNRIFNSSSVIFRKKSYNKIKNRDYKNMLLCGDWLLWVQIVNNQKIVHVKSLLNYHRINNSNLTQKFRSKGYDFLEGIVVFNTVKKYCSNNYDRKKVYLIWRNRIKLYKQSFSYFVIIKIYVKIILNEPYMFLYHLYRDIKSFPRKIFHLYNL